MVHREGRDNFDVWLEELGEPNVLVDDLSSGLDVGSTRQLGIGETPTCSTTGARLLRNGKSNTGG